jgi:ABC-type cobalamin/Fe3+-siderophores transport system ATPase subunit
VYLHFAFVMTPLQRYYISCYLETGFLSTMRQSSEYQLVTVADRQHHARPITEEDVQPGSTPQPIGRPIPLALSQTARSLGVIYLYRGTKVSYQNRPLHEYLRKFVYGGNSFLAVFEVPLWSGLAIFLFQLPFAVRKDVQRLKEMKYGRLLKGPIMVSPKAFNKAIKGDGVGFRTTESKDLMRIPLRAEGQHIELMGDTGTGKTTLLRSVREAAESRGYVVEGFAPTSRAANKLRDAGISADTLQGFLVRARRPTTERHLYMVDESSLASTKQVRDFLAKLDPGDRVLLIGDTRQHQGVEAGAPFEQLVNAGMKTAQLDQIVRQREAPELLKAVEHLSRGEIAEGVALLEQQGRVTEIADAQQRIAAIARSYVASPDNTIVVSPDNASRRQINQAVRSELQALGTVAAEKHTMRVLAPRSDMTGADRTWAACYTVDDVLYYPRGSKDIGIEKHSYTKVIATDPKENLLTVRKDDGATITYNPARLYGVNVYRELEREFAVGDRLSFTAPSKELGVANRDLGTVQQIDRDGRLTLKMDNGRSVSFNVNRMRHLDHGYAVTSHSSQGLTADRVLVNIDTNTHPDLINSRFAYVSVSRAALDSQIFTDNASTLTNKLDHVVSKTSAVEMATFVP